MALVNLFNMMNMRPHIPYRFKAEIWPNIEGEYEENKKDIKRYEFTVKRVSQPVFKLNTENKKIFGNTAYVVPILKYGETTMEITFEETDDMQVFKLLANYMGNELYKGIKGGLINIRLTEFDESMSVEVDKKVYVCRLKDHSMPNFNNNSFGSPVEITAIFNVVYIMEEPTVIETTESVIKREILPDNEFIQLNAEKTFAEEKEKELEKEIEKDDRFNFTKNLKISQAMQVLKAEQIKTSSGIAQQAMLAMGYDPLNENHLKRFNEDLKQKHVTMDDGFNNSELKILTEIINDNYDSTTSSDELIKNLKENINDLEKVNHEYNRLLKESTAQENYNYVSRTSMKDIPTKSYGTFDFIVSQNELMKNLEKIHAAGYKNVTMDALRDVSIENAKRMNKSYSGLKNELKDNGVYSVSVNTYNDAGHKVGINSNRGSHLLGQKVDVTFYKNGKKITIANATDEDREYLSKVAKNNGLIINWETAGGSNSGWGDIALKNAMHINDKGNVEEINIKQWTKKGKYYNARTKSQENFG